MTLFLRFLNKSFGVYNIRGIYVEPTYWMAGAIILLIFLLVFTIARIRYLYVHWSMGKQNISMLFWGFLLALIVEGFLILSGRTLLTEVIGWKNAPKPVSTVLDIGRERLVTVLGVTEEIPNSAAYETPTYQSVIGDFENLTSEDKEALINFICKP